MSRLLKVTSLVVLIPVAAACASASATGKAADRPGLVIPPPPPHVIPINAEPIAEPVPELPSATAGTPATRAPGRGTRETPPRPAAADTKPETRPEPVAEVPPPATPPAPATPPPQLRTAESSAAEAGVRASLNRTRDLLSGVDYRSLSNARRKAYNDAKRFAQQAEDALKAGNAVFAQAVSTKAETLAKELAGR